MWSLTLRSPTHPPRDYVLKPGRSRLGRGPDNDIVIADDTASLAHAEIEYNRDTDTVILRDLQSQAGTFVNQRRIAEPHRLQPDDQIRIGQFVAGVARTGQQPVADLAGAGDPYHMLFQQSVEAIYLLDPSSRRVHEANPAFLSLLGYTAEAVRHLSIYDFVAADRESIDAVLDRILVQGATTIGERVWRRKDGGRVDVHVTASKIRSDGRELVFVMALDITRRKQVEEAARRRLETLEALSRVSATLREARTRKEMLPLLVRNIQQVVGADGAVLFLCEDRRLILAASHGFGDDMQWQWYPRSDDVFWRMIQSTAPTFISGEAPPEIDALRHHALVGPFFDGFAAWTFFPLKTATTTVGALHLTFRQPFEFSEEQTWLLSALADMAATALQRLTFLETLEQQVVDRARDLEALYDVAALSSAGLDVPAVLGRAFERILVAMQARSGTIQLLDDSEATLTLALHVGLSDDLVQRLATQPAGAGMAGWVIANRDALLVSDLISDPRAAAWGAGVMPQIYLGVPLQTKSRTLGVISVFRKIGQMFKPEEVSLLRSLANHVGVAIENAQLHRQVEHTAVMEERQRLARDLHDAVTQSLYSLTLFTEGARELIQANDVERAQQYLAEIALAARQALKEMRLLIYELRPPVLEREGLAGALRHRLDAVEGRANVKTRLLVEGRIELSPRLAVELYYIAQEALNNVLKHAGASTVTVQIRAEGGCVELTVQDNGVGFIQAQAGEGGGIGLANIRERVKKLGGTVEILSTPDKGTTLKVGVCLPAGSEQGGQAHG